LTFPFIEQGVPAGECQKHYLLRLLQHQLREATSIQVPDLRQDILREHRHTLPSTPTPSRDLRRSRRTQRRGPEQIARIKQIAWNTVARSLEKAAHSCRRFNHRRIGTLAVAELQADEIRTIVGNKKHPIWIFTTIDVWSWLWPATVVGRRSYPNTLALFQDVASRMNLERVSLITTEGFQFYKRVVRRIWGQLVCTAR
jgi:IS1 family transposase